MTPRVIAALVPLISFAHILAADTSQSVLGRWSDGTNTLTFSRDGSVVARPLGKPGHAGTPVTLKFRTEGDRVIIRNQAGQQLVHELEGEFLRGPNGERFKRWDIIIVVFGFTMAADGSRHDIRVVRCEDPMDEHEIKGALTKKDEQKGIKLMAQRKFPVPKQYVGTTRYDFMLFDSHTRTYLPRA